MAAVSPTPSPDPRVEEVLSPRWWETHQASVADWLMTSGLRILAIIVLYFVVLRFVRFFVEKSVRVAVRSQSPSPVHMLMAEKRQQTLIHLLEAVATISLALLGLVMIFHELGFAVGPLIASAGIVGVAVGFGAQSLVKDIISGAFIILESQFSVGDVISTGDHSGAVEEINLRTTVLRGADGGVHIIPNGDINRVTVLTRDWSRLVLDIGIGYTADVPAAKAIIQREMETYSKDFPDQVLEAPEVLGVESLGESSVVIRAWMKVLPGKQWPAGRELRARIKKAFDEAGIEIPFPQRTLWVKNDGSPSPQASLPDR